LDTIYIISTLGTGEPRAEACEDPGEVVDRCKSGRGTWRMLPGLKSIDGADQRASDTELMEARGVEAFSSASGKDVEVCRL
jgi:hypothetical protein